MNPFTMYYIYQIITTYILMYSNFVNTSIKLREKVNFKVFFLKDIPQKKEELLLDNNFC